MAGGRPSLMNVHSLLCYTFRVSRVISQETALERQAVSRAHTARARGAPRKISAADHREAARGVVHMTLWHIEQWLQQPAGQIGVKDLVALYREVCDRAGFLSGRDLAAAESSRWQIAATLLASPNLSPDERKEILERVQRRENDVLAEGPATPVADVSADLGTEE